MVVKKNETSVALRQISERRLAANRLNAQKSTGPRTVAGKAKSKENALTHGLLAKEVVIQAGEGKENKAEFDRLHAQLWEELNPEGILEGMLVENIAACYWRKRRAFRCEIGEIRKELDSATWRESLERERQFDLAKSFLCFSHSSNWEMETSSRGTEYLLGVLESVKKVAEEIGYLGESELDMLAKNFGADDFGFTRMCGALSYSVREALGKLDQAPDDHGHHLSPEKYKKILLQLISVVKQELKEQQKAAEKVEHLELDAKIASLALPPKEAMEKILRYETAIDRQLYRAMGELERLQRQRRGEAVLPPIKVQISGQE